MVSPELSNSKVLVSDKSILFMSKLGLSLTINSIVFLITVSVFKPRKSNLTNPASSEDFMSNCVTGIGKLEDKSLYSGTNSSKFLSPITTPAA